MARDDYPYSDYNALIPCDLCGDTVDNEIDWGFADDETGDYICEQCLITI